MSRPLQRGWWSPRWLDRLSALLAIVALAALAWRGAPGVSPRAVRVPATGTEAIAARTDADSLAARIVATNLFSATRRTPRERFAAPGVGAAEVPVASDASAVAAASTDSDGLRVVGIVSVNGMRRALVDVGAGDSTTRLVTVGDRVGSYRVRRIDADVVELSSSAGTRTVRLSRRPSPDSSESLP